MSCPGHFDTLAERPGDAPVKFHAKSGILQRAGLSTTSRLVTGIGVKGVRAK